MKKITFLVSIVICILLINCKSKQNIPFEKVISYASELNLPKEDVFYINSDSLIKVFKGKKISLQNHGIKVLNINYEILKTKDGKCTIEKLNEVSSLENLEVDFSESSDFINIYPNLKNKLKEEKFTILCIWSMYYPKKVTLENIGFAKEKKNKYKNCQILYLNADIYKELYQKINQQ